MLKLVSVGLMLATTVVVASMISAIARPYDAMAKCQTSYSYDVCLVTLN